MFHKYNKPILNKMYSCFFFFININRDRVPTGTFEPIVY